MIDSPRDALECFGASPIDARDRPVPRAAAGGETVDLTDVTVVVPSVGRSSLRRLLDALAAEPATLGGLVVVDDRRAPDGPVAGGATIAGTVVHSGGRGPAAARNAGWRQADTGWVAFLDDDVVPHPGWAADLRADLDRVAPEVAATQASIDVPPPSGRAATDRERNVARLQGAPWITADLAVRRAALRDVAGFDERFPRAYREDTDLALRLEERGWRLAEGRRRTSHPVGPAPWWASIAAQRGNRDDALLRAVHGKRWRSTPGRRRRHIAITVAGAVALAATSTGRRPLALVALAGWAAGTAEFATSRTLAGPRTSREVATMLVTSVGIPPAATAWWIVGRLRWRCGGTPPWHDVR